MSSPTFVPLTIFRGLAGVAFLCFGELFWMHMSRIGLEGEGKVLGTIALVLGASMAIGALCGAAGISVRIWRRHSIDDVTTRRCCWHVKLSPGFEEVGPSKVERRVACSSRLAPLARAIQ